MQTIKLDPKYSRLVKTRQKVQTIRLGRKKYEIGPAMFEAGNELIPIKIIEVDYVPVSGLDSIDARRDGFDTVEQLKEALKVHYPQINEHGYVTVVSFEYNMYG